MFHTSNCSSGGGLYKQLLVFHHASYEESILFVFPTYINVVFNPYPTAFPYGNSMVLHFYQQQESSTTKIVHKVINRGLKTYV